MCAILGLLLPSECQSGISEPNENPAVHAASIQSREQGGNQMVEKPMETAAQWCHPGAGLPCIC